VLHLLNLLQVTLHLPLQNRVLQVTPHLPLQNRVNLFLHFQVEQLQRSLQQVQQEEQKERKIQVLFQLVPNRSRLLLVELVEEVELEELRGVLSQSAPAVHLSTALFF